MCSNRYKGIHCETEREICFEDVVCLNGGICTFSDNESVSFCECEPGFSGIDCSHNINDCENVTCENGGRCVYLFITPVLTMQLKRLYMECFKLICLWTEWSHFILSLFHVMVEKVLF